MSIFKCSNPKCASPCTLYYEVDEPELPDYCPITGAYDTNWNLVKDKSTYEIDMKKIERKALNAIRSN